MKLVHLTATLTACALLFAGEAVAGETVIGSGLTTCDAYLEADDAAKLSSENWVLGFLSSANLRARNLDLLVRMDNGTVIDAVEAYCQQHPSASITDASIALLKSLVASADGDCLQGPGASPANGQLSLCKVPGAADSTRESRTWQMRTPGAE